MTPRFRQREVVRIRVSSGTVTPRGIEGVVEEVLGPNEAGTAWCVTLRLAGDDRLLVCSEDELEPTGLAEAADGEPVPVADLPVPEERRDRIELRLVTSLTDGIDAARVASEIEQHLQELVGDATITTEAERHWAEPFTYELIVTVEPLDDPVSALQALADAGGDGWLACTDDGWRCDLWWCADDEEFIVPEVRGAGVVFLPWRSPRRRPEADRPLVDVPVPGAVDDPRGPCDGFDGPGDDGVRGSGGQLEGGPFDPEPGDEEP